jgi:hypothetical protein
MNVALVSAQVSLFHVSNLPTVPPPTTCCRLRDLIWFVPGAYRVICNHIPFEDQSVIWASPFPSRLATTTSRIEFVILRTGRSLSVALHSLSRGRSCFRLQSSAPTSTGTFTLLIRYTYKRTRRRLPSPIWSVLSPCGDETATGVVSYNHHLERLIGPLFPRSLACRDGAETLACPENMAITAEGNVRPKGHTVAGSHWMASNAGRAARAGRLSKATRPTCRRAS